jgi:hypothetical protein
MPSIVVARASPIESLANIDPIVHKGADLWGPNQSPTNTSARCLSLSVTVN